MTPVRAGSPTTRPGRCDAGADAGVPEVTVLSSDERRLAESVRDACLNAARDAAEDAGISGLCWEGRLEAALDAIRALRVDDLLKQSATGNAGTESVPPGGGSRE